MTTKEEILPQSSSGEGLTLGIIKAKPNPGIMKRLLEGARLTAQTLQYKKIIEVPVPSCYDLPLGAKYLAETNTVTTIVCIGAMLRGGTNYFDLASGISANGAQGIQMSTGIPTAYSVLTVEYQQQAIKRSSLSGGRNIAADAVQAATEMTQLKRTLAGYSSNPT